MDFTDNEVFCGGDESFVNLTFVSFLMIFQSGQATTCCGTGTRGSVGSAGTPSPTPLRGTTRPGASLATRSSPPPTRLEISLMWRSSSTPTTSASLRSSSVLLLRTPRRPTSVLKNIPWLWCQAQAQTRARGGERLELVGGSWWSPTSPAGPRVSGGR